MKIRNVRNNLENKVHSMWSYFDTINTRGITLIALIITIILMLILAGVVISLTIGENGIFKIAKQAAKNYTNAQIAETSGINEIEKQLTDLDLELPLVPYEGLGYKFIYDGTLGEAGQEGKNMCNEVTGGWASQRTSYSADGGKSYIWYMGWILTNNKIDLTNYSKLCISSNMVGNDFGAFSKVLLGKQKPENNHNNTTFDDVIELEYGAPGKTIGFINIPNNWNGYVGISSCHSTETTYYFDYQSSYMRNYTDSTRYIDVYNIVALKEDNWKAWAKLAKVDVESEENNSLEKILNNTTTLEKIFNNKRANEYMLKCTGTLMVEILKNDNSYNNIPNVLLEKMKENTSWNHFLKVCERI